MSRNQLSEKNKELFGRFIAALNKWDFAELERITVDDFVFEMPYAPDGFVRRLDGKDAWLQFMDAMPGFIDGDYIRHVEINTFANDPNEIVAEYESKTRLIGTGEEYENNYIVRASVRDGKIQRFAEYYEPVALIEAMGGSVIVPKLKEE